MSVFLVQTMLIEKTILILLMEAHVHVNKDFTMIFPIRIKFVNVNKLLND